MRPVRVLVSMVAAGVLATGAGATTAGKPYRSSIFEPAFSAVVPAGWTVAERDPRGVQMYKPCGTCPEGGEENGEVTLDMALAAAPLARAIQVLHRTSGIAAGPIRPTTIGSLHGLAFTAGRKGLAIQFYPAGYSTDTTGPPLRILVARVAGKTLTVFLDPPIHHPTRVASFMATANGILKSLRFRA